MDTYWLECEKAQNANLYTYIMLEKLLYFTIGIKYLYASLSDKTVLHFEFKTNDKYALDTKLTCTYFMYPKIRHQAIIWFYKI